MKTKFSEIVFFFRIKRRRLTLNVLVKILAAEMTVLKVFKCKHSSSLVK